MPNDRPSRLLEPAGRPWGRRPLARRPWSTKGPGHLFEVTAHTCTVQVEAARALPERALALGAS